MASDIKLTETQIIIEGNLGIDQPNPTKAKLEVAGSVDNTVAIFGSGWQGISLTYGNPSVGFNAYYSGAWKSMAKGWGGWISMGQDTGNFDICIGSKTDVADTIFSSSKVLLRITSEGAVITSSNVTIRSDKNPSKYWYTTIHQDHIEFIYTIFNPAPPGGIPTLLSTSFRFITKR